MLDVESTMTGRPCNATECWDVQEKVQLGKEVDVKLLEVLGSLKEFGDVDWAVGIILDCREGSIFHLFEGSEQDQEWSQVGREPGLQTV